LKDKPNQISITPTKENKPIGAEKPMKRYLVFQVKLALDAIRDILLGPVALVATLIDMAEKNHGKNSHFERLMKVGRISERHINLFNQHKQKSQSVESVFDQVENVIKKEYQDGQLTAKAKKAIEAKLRRSKRT
jgi:predicted Co/Zn/Cd cation transporter (cation efflux family)